MYPPKVSDCAVCGKPIGTVERIFTTSNQVCLDCRNKDFARRMKTGLG